MRTWLAAAGAGLVLAVSAGAQASDPIVGAWTVTGGGARIAVTPAGSGFIGTVTVAYNSQNGCNHPVGQRVWEEVTRQADGTYRGVNHGFQDGPGAGCPDQRQAVTFTIGTASGGKLPMQVCNANFGCSGWTRPLGAGETRIYRWFFNASFSNPKAPKLVASFASGPLGPSTGDVSVAGGNVGGGQGAFVKITDTLSGGKKRLIWLRTNGLAGPFSAKAGGGGTLELAALVTRSDYSNCAKGRRIFLTLRDGAGAVPDSFAFRACGISRTYVGGRPGVRVTVVIGEKR